MKISREIKVAILVISGVVLFIYLFSYLKGENLFSDDVTYYTEFDYKAFEKASPITVNGNNIGKIEDIIYDFETGKTRVEFTVDPRFTFSKSSLIRKYDTGLMGGSALAIIDSFEGPKAEDGDFIKSEVEAGMISSISDSFSNIAPNLDRTLVSADTLLVNLNGLIGTEKDNGLKAAVVELNNTMKSFKDLSYVFKTLVKDNDEKIAKVLTNFEKVSGDFAVLSEDLKKAQLSKTIDNLDQTMVKFKAVLSGLENGEGSLGKLLKDDKMYDNLERASREMELLILDIKLHPARYRRILSKREIPYEPPTQEQINDKEILEDN